MTKKEKNTYLILLVLALSAVYGFSDMKHVFYNILGTALGLGDGQLGMLWGIFGAVAMLSYIGGGFLADRVAPSRLLCVALLASGILHALMAAASTGGAAVYPLLLVISAGMGVCAVFLYFPASSRILATMSREHSGSVLGKYYGFGGLLTSVLDLAATAIYARVESEIFLFRGIMLFFAVVNLVTGTLIGLKFWNQKTDIEKGNPVRLRDVSAVLRQPKVWLIALITMCNYLICCLMSYYTPYLTGVFGVSESYALLIAVIRLGVFSLAAGLIWGKWTDRIGSATRVIRFSFVLLAVLFAGLLVNDRWGRSSIAVILITFGIALISLGNKSMTLVLFTEKQISPRVLGTAIGIVSFIGYSPDAFFYPAAGKILEQTGDGAYAILFLIGIAAALIGMLCGNTLIQKLPD